MSMFKLLLGATAGAWTFAGGLAYLVSSRNDRRDRFEFPDAATTLRVCNISHD